VSRVAEGDRLKLHYTGRTPDGEVFDTSRGGEPFELVAGSSELVAGVSRAVLGMAVGESKTVVVRPDDGYGRPLPGMSRRVPRSLVPPDTAVGDAVEVSMGDGAATLWVKEMNGDVAVLDANHPLAGQTLEFDLEVVEIVSRSGA